MVKSKEQIRQFLHGIYGARTADRKVMFSPERGIALDLLPSLGKTTLLTEEASLCGGKIGVMRR